MAHQSGVDKEALLSAAKNGRIDEVKSMIASGVDVNATDEVCC